MRVMRVRRRHDDRGAVLLVVAVFTIVAVIFLAFVVDIGNQRQDRRQFTTATDASALDVAQEWSIEKLSSTTFPAGDCSDMANFYLDKNRAEAPDSYTCTATKVNGRMGSVTVSADGSVDYQVANAIGINEGQTASSTTVRIRSNIGGGLRPFAVCGAETPELQAWIAAAQTGAPAPTDLIIGGPKFLPSNCGENNGNWGMVAFQSQDSGVGNIQGNGLSGTLARGSLDETITVDQSASGDPTTECNKSYETQASENGISCVFQVTGNPWTNDGVEDAFDYLKTEGIVFNLPVYGDRVDLGGSHTGFPIIGFLEVELLSYCGDPTPTAKALLVLANPATCQGGNNNFVHVRLLKMTTGTCCDVNKDNRLLEICDVGDLGGSIVTADILQNCQTPDGTSGPPPPVPDADCTLVSASPASQSVPVSNTGSSTQPAVVSFEVLDAADCGVMTVDARGPNTVGGTVTGPVSNVYTATFPSGTTFTPAAATYDVELFEDGSLLDDSTDLVTAPIAPCQATAPTFSPSPAREQKPGGKPSDPPSYNDNLVSDLTVTTNLTNVPNCSVLTIKVFHPTENRVLEQSPSPLGATVSATFSKSPPGGWKWSSGTYTVQVQRNGALLPGAESTFTLP